LADEVSSGAPFGSDLTPQEAALVLRTGFRPIGVVVGSSFYHVGMLFASFSDGELLALTQAYNTALDLAVRRLKLEAVALQAHGVVGVRLTMRRHEWAEHMIEVVVVGTAVRGDGPVPHTPFTSDISGQEFWQLHEAGFAPRALVYGSSVWVVFTSQMDLVRMRSWSNVEMEHMANCVYRCRHAAMERLRRQAAGSGAGGVVGVRYNRTIGELRIHGTEQEHHTIDLTVFGTAIAPHAGGVEHRPRTVPMIDLRAAKPAITQQADVTLE